MTPNPAPAVVGVDGSPQSLTAVDWAAREAVARRCPLRILHAFPSPPLDAPMRPPAGPPDPALQHAAEQVMPSPATVTAIRVFRCDKRSSTARSLISSSPNLPAAALTVVGSRGRGGFTGLLLGSTSQRLLHHATGSVAIVRPTPPATNSAPTPHR